MAMLKFLGVLALLGAIAGAIVASFITPSLLTWYNTASDVNALCNCATVAKSTVEQLIRSQLIGAAIGGVSLPILGAVVSSRMKKKQPPTAGTSAPGSAS